MRSAGKRLTVVMSTSFGCPFEGEVPVARVVEVALGALEARPDELSLADTIGVAVPSDVVERVGAVRAIDTQIALRCHFHNTRNTAIANIVAALDVGVRSFDASLAGVGGCPFAPAATGNVATEDVAYLLGRMGYETGLDLSALLEAARWLSYGDVLGRSPEVRWPMQVRSSFGSGDRCRFELTRSSIAVSDDAPAVTMTIHLPPTGEVAEGREGGELRRRGTPDAPPRTSQL